jgi:hypothetical protein
MTECEDLRLMIRLMHHARGYTSDGGRALSSEELVRLLVLGGKLQVEACVAQCVDRLKAGMKGLDPGAAMEVLESVPSEMDGVKGVEALRSRGLYFLLKAIKAERLAGVELQRAWGIVIKCIEQRSAAKAPLEARGWDPVRDMLAADSLGEEIEGAVADAVARYLGPIHKLWRGRKISISRWSEGLSKGAKVSPIGARLVGVKEN